MFTETWKQKKDGRIQPNNQFAPKSGGWRREDKAYGGPVKRRGKDLNAMDLSSREQRSFVVFFFLTHSRQALPQIDPSAAILPSADTDVTDEHATGEVNAVVGVMGKWMRN
jgi:hypothetical protein